MAFDGNGFAAFELVGEFSADLLGHESLAGVRARGVAPVVIVLFCDVTRVQPGILLGVLFNLDFATREHPLGGVVDLFCVPGEPVENFTSLHWILRLTGVEGRSEGGQRRGRER